MRFNNDRCLQSDDDLGHQITTYSIPVALESRTLYNRGSNDRSIPLLLLLSVVASSLLLPLSSLLVSSLLPLSEVAEDSKTMACRLLG